MYFASCAAKKRTGPKRLGPMPNSVSFHMTIQRELGASEAVIAEVRAGVGSDPTGVAS